VKPGPTAFASAAAFRKWLEAHHADTDELVLCLYKKHASERGLTYRDALDEALCFGWIDGITRRLDEDTYAVRFTPRRRGSRWSAVNVRRAKELIAAGRMQPPGRSAFEARTGDSAGYSFEAAQGVLLAPALLRRFRANRAAWEWWQGRPPWYRRTCSFWVMEGKREETRERRFVALVEACARGTVVPPLKMLEAKLGRASEGGSRNPSRASRAPASRAPAARRARRS
jgi:uncharacterized protein YdeI (YjbR/CyaY-like superfamily)